MKEIFESKETWQKGIPLLVDITIADLTKEGDYYKHGMDSKDFIKK